MKTEEEVKNKVRLVGSKLDDLKRKLADEPKNLIENSYHLQFERGILFGLSWVLSRADED